MFTERELELILEALEATYHEIITELNRWVELGLDVTFEERDELDALISKARKLFLEA